MSKSAAVQSPPEESGPGPAGVPVRNYATDIEYQREVWRRKPALRALYAHWYAQCVGAGEASAHRRGWLRLGQLQGILSRIGRYRRADGHRSRPGRRRDGFAVEKRSDRKHRRLRRDPSSAASPEISQASDRGRLVLCEPAMSLWSRFVFRYFHHEAFDLSWPLFDLDGRPPDPDPAHAFSNQAIPEILFWKERERTLAELGPCKLVEARKFGFLLYPLSGGFSAHSFLPCRGLPTLLKMEDWVTRPFSPWLTGMRMLVVLEKTH